MNESNAPRVGTAAVFWLFVLSVLLIALTFLTAFLFIPILIFPAASIVCSILSAKKYRNTSKPSVFVRLILLLPIPAAIATFLFWVEIFSNEKWH